MQRALIGTIVRAERKVQLALEEPSSASERLAARLGSTRWLWSMAAVAIAWIAVNQSLHGLGLPSLDPAPFRWLQRASLVASVFALVLSAKASNERRARSFRREAAQRELFEAIAAAHPHEHDQRYS